MPTRILLNDQRSPSPRFPSSPPKHNSLSLTGTRSVGEETTNHQEIGITSSKNNNNNKYKKRKIVSLKSSIIRGKRNNDDLNLRALSSEDIRASPRLLGYCFQLLASIVMLISVSTFYGDEFDKNVNTFNATETNTTGTIYDISLFWSPDGKGHVRKWKLICSFIVSIFGTVVTAGIIMAHFDTIFLPSFWQRTFRDGSEYEQKLLISLVVFWMLALHVNTSSLSVGRYQANVFFTSWISFFSSILNFGQWRMSSNLPSIAEMVDSHHRETTYNWLWVLFCNLIFAGALCDIYFNRNHYEWPRASSGDGTIKHLWMTIMLTTSALVLVSFLAIVFNHFLRKSCELRVPYFHSNTKKGTFVLLGWRQAEGIFIVSIIATLFYIVFAFTGGNGTLNGLNNAYFGVWGAFINSIMLLGTWLRENKNIESINNEETRNKREKM